MVSRLGAPAAGTDMVKVQFTQNLRRHVDAPHVLVPGGTVRSVLEAVFETNPQLRGYVLDDQGALRNHVSIFVGSSRVGDRVGLSDPVDDASQVYVMQALSGG